MLRPSLSLHRQYGAPQIDNVHFACACGQLGGSPHVVPAAGASPTWRDTCASFARQGGQGLRGFFQPSVIDAALVSPTQQQRRHCVAGVCLLWTKHVCACFHLGDGGAWKSTASEEDFPNQDIEAASIILGRRNGSNHKAPGHSTEHGPLEVVHHMLVVAQRWAKAQIRPPEPRVAILD